jgi:hypothetical protein
LLPSHLHHNASPTPFHCKNDKGVAALSVTATLLTSYYSIPHQRTKETAQPEVRCFRLEAPDLLTSDEQADHDPEAVYMAHHRVRSFLLYDVHALTDVRFPGRCDTLFFLTWTLTLAMPIHRKVSTYPQP